jgi:hypothetical protein
VAGLGGGSPARADLDSQVLGSSPVVWATTGEAGLMARYPVPRPGDTLRLGGQTHTVAAVDSAMVRPADVIWAVREVPTAGLLADPGLDLVSPSRVPMAAPK